VAAVIGVYEGGMSLAVNSARLPLVYNVDMCVFYLNTRDRRHQCPPLGWAPTQRLPPSASQSVTFFLSSISALFLFLAIFLPNRFLQLRNMRG